MRKICCLLFAVFILCISASCYQRKETRISQPVIMPAIQSPEDIDDYIGEKGYEILESKGKTEEYTLDKKRCITIGKFGLFSTRSRTIISGRKYQFIRI